MPNNVIKSMVAKGKGTELDLEHKWERAVAIADEAGKSENYAYIMGIFKNMTGGKKSKKSALEILSNMYGRTGPTAWELLKCAELASTDQPKTVGVNESSSQNTSVDLASKPASTVAGVNVAQSGSLINESVNEGTGEGMNTLPVRTPGLGLDNVSNADGIGVYDSKLAQNTPFVI